MRVSSSSPSAGPLGAATAEESEAILRWLVRKLTTMRVQLLVLVGSVTLLSSLVKNIGALAMLMLFGFDFSLIGLIGIVLLIAMIGAIVLTLRHKPNVKRQNIADQVARNPATAIEVVKVQPGQGLQS